MSRKVKAAIAHSKFRREDAVTINNRTIYAGEVIKINGEHGGRFRFHSLVTNEETGAQWIDCFEMQKGAASAWRSFKSDRIKVIPIKRGRRNVNRSTAS